MTLVEMYSKDECHLCDVALAVLMNIQKTLSFEFRQIKIHEGDEYFEKFKERVPVIFINKEFVCQYRVSEKEFINKLRAVEQSH